jgi:hypothetical protein
MRDSDLTGGRGGERERGWYSSCFGRARKTRRGRRERGSGLNKEFSRTTHLRHPLHLCLHLSLHQYLHLHLHPVPRLMRLQYHRPHHRRLRHRFRLQSPSREQRPRAQGRDRDGDWTRRTTRHTTSVTSPTVLLLLHLYLHLYLRQLFVLGVHPAHLLPALLDHRCRQLPLFLLQSQYRLGLRLQQPLSKLSAPVFKRCTTNGTFSHSVSTLTPSHHLVAFPPEPEPLSIGNMHTWTSHTLSLSAVTTQAHGGTRTGPWSTPPSTGR